MRLPSSRWIQTLFQQLSSDRKRKVSEAQKLLELHDLKPHEFLDRWAERSAISDIILTEWFSVRPLSPLAVVLDAYLRHFLLCLFMIFHSTR